MINTNTLKLAGYAALAVIVAGTGGYVWARSVHKPEIVEVRRIACGVPPATAAFGVPLETAMRSVGQLPFGVGPVEMPQGGGLVQLTFDPSTDGKGREVRMLGDTLLLPTAFGRDGSAPERITITCRDGTVASVRYTGKGRGGTTFNVVREEVTAMAPEASDLPAEAAEPAAPAPSSN